MELRFYVYFSYSQTVVLSLKGKLLSIPFISTAFISKSLALEICNFTEKKKDIEAEQYRGD